MQEYDMLKEAMTGIFENMTIEMTDKCNVLGTIHMGFQGATPIARQFECREQDRLMGLVFQVRTYVHVEHFKWGDFYGQHAKNHTPPF